MEKKIGRKYWNKEEDEKLIQYVNTHGKGKWKTVAENLGLGKTASSCSQRWKNHLSPGVVRGGFTEEEKLKILILQSQLGNQWAKISRGFPGRTDNEIKNFFNKHFAKEARLMKKKRARGGGGGESGGHHGHTLAESNDGGITFPPFDVDEQLGGGGGSNDREYTSPPPCGGGGDGVVTESGGPHGHTLLPESNDGSITFPSFDVSNYDGGVYSFPPPFLSPCGGDGHGFEGTINWYFGDLW